MPKSKVFISHSSTDKPFAERVVNVLHNADLSPWIDAEQIFAGETLLREIGDGLQTMDVLVALVSQSSLNSGWVEEELSFAMHRVINKEILLLPFRIDNTAVTELPWYLQTRLTPYITADDSGAHRIAESVKRSLAQRRRLSKIHAPTGSHKVLDIEELKIAESVQPGDWSSAEVLATKIAQQTDRLGGNQIFEALVEAVTAEPPIVSQDSLIGVCSTIEKCAELLPNLVDRQVLWKLALHSDFSVRSSAAAICLDLAQFAPDRVPVDLLFRLAVPDEDWYVDAPATAALLSLANGQPAVLRFFYSQVDDADADARSHGAAALARIAKTQPEILNQEDLQLARTRLEALKDSDATKEIRNAITLVKRTKKTENPRYRYGL